MDRLVEVALCRKEFALVVLLGLQSFPLCCFGPEGSGGVSAYTYHGVLSLDAGFQALLLDLDDQVPALEVAWYSAEGDIYVANRLLPLIRKSILLGLLLGAGGCLLGGGRFYEDISLTVGIKESSV